MIGPATLRGGPREGTALPGILVPRRGWRGVLLFILASFSIQPELAEAQNASVLPAAHGEALPPAVIEGLNMRPSVPLEFSRAWLGKADEVRRRRAELHAAGLLDGVAPGDLVEQGGALTGELRVPVIAVRYADVRPPYPVTALAARLFGSSTADTVSFSDYWHEVSGGLLRATGIVTSWVSLRKSADHYLSREEYGWGGFGRIGELRRQVLEQVDPFIDFALFDNDGPDGIPNSGDDDGYVDFVAFFYATDCSRDPREGAIWPHRGAMTPFETDDGAADGSRVRIADYVILPAQDPKTCGPAHIGVLAHETAHAFGLPDLYDYDGSSAGVGAWDLLGTGSHASPHSPAHPGAWVKEQLGWVQVDWVGRPGSATFQPAGSTPRVLRHELDDRSGRYLLLEQRTSESSDRDLPGHGLLAWSVDPERAELGAWNGDERRPAVGLLGADEEGILFRLDGLDDSGPFPGEPGPAGADGGYPVRVHADSVEDGLRVTMTPAEGSRWREQEVHLATVVGGETLQNRAAVREAEAQPVWVARSSASWLRLIDDDDGVVVEADPFSMAPGTYRDTLDLMDALSARVTDRLPVMLEVAAFGAPAVVATNLPWSWGMAASGGDLVQASYGWDPLGLRPRPRLLRVDAGDPFPRTLSRLPVEALYSPAVGPDDATYVLGHALGRNLIYRVGASGNAEVVTADVGEEPAYGLTVLPDGSFLVAGFSGHILRVATDGTVTTWAQLQRAVYQIDSDADGSVYAALLGGDVARIDTAGRFSMLETGFSRGDLVAITVAADGRVFAAERGGRGRILELTERGPRQLARVKGGEFYGLATDELFLYALDLGKRELLRLPITGPDGRILADAPHRAPRAATDRAGTPQPTPAAVP